MADGTDRMIRSGEARPLARMKSITTVMSVLTFGVVAVILLLNSLNPWWHAAVLAPSLIATMWVVTRWHTGLDRRTLTALLVLGTVTWIVAVLAGMSPVSMLGLAATGSIAIATRSRNRPRDSILLIGLVAVAGLPVLLVRPDELADYTLSAAFYAALFISIFWLNDITWRLFTELDAMRRTEAELAVMKERFRFASDLHDIQGHTLHVIRLKAAVAAKLQHSDPERTARELQDIQQLTVETIEQARDLASSTHKLTFSSELANATNLLEAAGIRVGLNGSASAVPDDALFALVLREATTNILRHSQARQAQLTIRPQKLTIRNDGAGPARPLRGLNTLQRRVSEAGGRLDARQAEESFELSLIMDPEPA